ncbi:MAG: hypothetical protein M3Q58_00855 [Bacteroidota bacterium]|nr:hypothetical protein [Bacteroidota bacterium]
MMRVLAKQFFFAVLLLLLSLAAKSQTFTSESDLKKHARKLFDNQEFVDAAPYFSQLLSLYPKDPEYNYKYGTCLLFSDSDKEKSIKFLEFASTKDGVEPEVFFYLGKAFHLGYRFENAIIAYNKFIEKGSSKSKSKLKPEREIEMCKNGKLLIRNITELVVMDKKEVKESDFFRSYDLGDFGGKIISKPDDFKTPFDLKQKEKSIMFLPSIPKEIYFASYGDNDKNGKDIYKVSKLADGEWSKPQSLGNIINTPFDEDFPFMHPNGKTLYFCSKGHNSMGGFDIFKSQYNEDDDTWSKPVNLDFAISSPDNDILFITDKEEKFAYFSSSRASIEGNITVYKINIERKPEEYILVNGKLLSDISNMPSSVTIKVHRTSDNELIGTFSTQPSGAYILKIPNGGRFKFLVETGRHPVQTGMVDVPTQKIPKPLKQEMELVKNDGGVKLTIRNLFDEEVSDEDQLLALDLIKNQAKLEVNFNPDLVHRFEQKEAHIVKEQKNKEQQNGTDKTPRSISNEEITQIAFQDAEAVKTEAEELKKEANFAFAFAEKKSKQADEKNKEAENLKQDALEIQDPSKQKIELDKAKEVKKTSLKLANEAAVSFKIAEKSDNDAKKKEAEAQIAFQYANELEAAVNSTSSKEAIDKLSIQKEKLQSSNNGKGAKDILSDTRKQYDEKNKEAEKLKILADESKNEVDELNAEIQNLEKEIDKTKDKNKKTDLSNQLIILKEDQQTAESRSKSYDEKIVKIEKEAESLNKDAGLIEKMITEIKLTTDQPVAINESQRKEIKKRIEEQKNIVPDKFDEPQDNLSENKTVNQNNNASNTNANTNNSSTEGIQSNPIKSTNRENEILDKNGKTINYAADFTQKLEQAELKSNGSEKEKNKASINAAWAESINSEINYRKDRLNSLEENKKSEEKKIIAKLEKELKEKNAEVEKLIVSSKNIEKQEAKQLTENTQKEQKENVISSKTTDEHFEGVADFAIKVEVNNEYGEIVDYNSAYIDQLDKTEMIEDDYDRERTKAEVLSNWSASASQEVFLRKENLKNLKGKEKKAEQSKIEEISNYALSRQIEADEFLANAALIKQTNEQELSSNEIKKDKIEKEDIKTSNKENNEIQIKEIAKNEVFEEEINYKQVDEEGIKNNESFTDNSSKNQNENNEAQNKKGLDKEIIENDNYYTSPVAKESFKRATTLKKEAEALTIQADNIRTGISSISDPVERNNQIIRANDLDKQSQLKQIDAAIVYSEAGNAEFKKNKVLLSNNLNPENESKDATVAGMLMDESDFYIKEAEKTKQKALENENLISQYNFLNQAIELEKTAIEKQNKAMELLNITPGSSDIVKKDKNQIKGDINEDKTKTAKTNKENNKIIIALNAESAKENENGEEFLRQAKELEEEAEDLALQAEKSKNKKEKKELQSQSAEKFNEAQVLTNQSIIAFEKAKELNEEATKMASVSNDPNETGNNAIANKQEFKEDKSGIDPEIKEDKNLKKQTSQQQNKENINKSNELKLQAEQKNKKGEEIRLQAQELDKEAQILTSNANATKKKKDKEQLNQQAIEKSEQANAKRAEAELEFEDARKLEIQANNNSSVATDPDQKQKQEKISANTTEAQKTKANETQNKQIEKKQREEKLVSLKAQIDEENQKAILLAQQAKELGNEAEDLSEKAEKSKKKKEKIELQKESVEKQEEANSKKEQSENSFSQVKELEKEIALIEKSNSSGIELKKEQASLSQNEINQLEQRTQQEKIIALNNKIKEENQKGIQLTQKASELEEEAQEFSERAEKSKKKKEKIELKQKSDEKQEEANSKKVKAQSAFENVKLLEEDLKDVTTLAEKLKQDEKKAKEKNIVVIPLNSVQQQQLIESGELENYKLLVSEINTNNELAENEFKKADVFRNRGKEFKEQSRLMTNEAEQEKDVEIRDEKLEESAVLKEKASININRADSIVDIAANIQAKALASQAQVERLLLTAENRTGENKVAKSFTDETRYEVPKVLTEPIFEKNAAPVYNSKNPIPVDIALPEGLVYKVQIGAFRNPIPFDLFKGFAPIMGETTPQGFTRYTAGMFKTIETANLAKDIIRGNGYNDAYVVVFYNGKRISMNEARALIAGGKIDQDKAVVANNIIKENNESTLSNQIEKQNQAAGNSDNNNVNTNDAFGKHEKVFPPDVAPYHELNTVQGLLYTVQVGVYTRAVPPKQLFNIQPLNVEKTSNGMLRYSSGVFNNTARANEAKNVIVSIGVKDAFVTAYFNGNRISVSEARKLETDNGNSVFIQSGSMNVLPGVSDAPVAQTFSNQTEKPVVSNTELAPKDKSKENVSPQNSDINNNNSMANNVSQTDKSLLSEEDELKNKSIPELEFKVQIGAFKEEVPLDIATKFLKISYLGINHYLNGEGLTVYSVGKYFNYTSANQMKDILIDSHDLKGAFVVAYYQQKKISINQAMEMLKNP